MTVLAADRKTVWNAGNAMDEPMIASDIIYLGGLCFRNTSGYISPVATAGFRFAGVAMERGDNASGAAGAVTVRLNRRGVHRFVCSGLAQADVGKPVFATDDQTVTLTPGTPFVGILDAFVSATVAAVNIEPAFAQGAGDIFDIAVYFPSTVGTAAVTALESWECPTRFMLLRSYAKCKTAPGGAYVTTISFTDGTTPKTMTITGAATTGESEAHNQIYEADTDIDVTLVDDDASGATADIQMNFICMRL
jgi:hypothetical protein